MAGQFCAFCAAASPMANSVAAPASRRTRVQRHRSLVMARLPLVGLCRPLANLFDHLVGPAKDRERESEAQRLRSLHVEDQLDSRGLLHGQIGGLLAFEDAAGI